jgi:AraC-like DNA-binding protein
LIAGFSIFSAGVLLFAYLFFLPDMRKTTAGKCGCSVLLAGLGALQWYHFHYFSTGSDLLIDRGYLSLLLLVPVAFYFFTRSVLFPEFLFSRQQLFHFLPLGAAFLLPASIVPGLAFLIGTGYTFWFARTVYRVREQSQRFKFEIFFFGLFALMALLALLLGLSLPFIEHFIFYTAYSTSIGVAILLVVAAIIIFPELLRDITEITEMAYARSKLLGLDISVLKEQLHQLMFEDEVYQNENLSMRILADLLAISSHQLSELINTEYGVGFPRFVREHRITHAKRLLIEERDASILSISMMTGFKSQSSFYTAFREVTGVAPGHYRNSSNSD